MNLIFGVIILAMFILALRVIWATCLQLLVMLKIGIAAMNRYRMQRNARAAIPVFMPRISHEVDWEVMSDTVRKEIQQRNSGIGREAARLDVELQVKTKTMELIKADIQIAKLEVELQKIRPVAVLQVSDSGKKRKRSKSADPAIKDEALSKSSHPVHQLRSALKTSNVPVVSTNDGARH